jgi:AcrR family transcriptional regulator
MGEQRKDERRRPYRMGRRQEQVDEMNRRIAEAAFELHATVGPAQTSISAVAERAGVQRHTVYHHFPDLTSLMRACTEHGMRVTRTPEAAPWRAIEDPTDRLRHGLGELYDYYSANARLLGNIVRDMPLLGDSAGAEAFIERMGELFAALADGWSGDAASQRLRMVAIGHAMSYDSWRSLTDRGLSDAEATELMIQFVATVAEASARTAETEARRSGSNDRILETRQGRSGWEEPDRP